MASAKGSRVEFLEAPVHIRFVSYNLHGCVGWDGRFDPARAVAVLNETGGDIVALQEVPALERGGERLLRTLCEASELRPIVGDELRSQFAHYGNALLTRFTCAERSVMNLAVGTREPRGAIQARLALDDTTLHVIATHLGLSPAERRTQIRRILAAVTSEVCPVALLGDINEWFTWGRPLRWLHAHFGRPPAPRSFPSLAPALRLDRVWVSRPSVVVSVHAHVSALSRQASDHLPVVASVELRNADQACSTSAGRRESDDVPALQSGTDSARA